jgi:hypothetical protein
VLSTRSFGRFGKEQPPSEVVLSNGNRSCAKEWLSGRDPDFYPHFRVDTAEARCIRVRLSERERWCSGALAQRQRYSPASPRPAYLETSANPCTGSYLARMNHPLRYNLFPLLKGEDYENVKGSVVDGSDRTGASGNGKGSPYDLLPVRRLLCVVLRLQVRRSR